MKCIYAKFQVSTCRTVEMALVSVNHLWGTFGVPLRLYKQYHEQVTPRLRFLLGPLRDRILILEFGDRPLRGWKRAEIAAQISVSNHGALPVMLTSISTTIRKVVLGHLEMNNSEAEKVTPTMLTLFPL